MPPLPQAGQYRSPKVTSIQKDGLNDEEIQARERVVMLMRNGKKQLKEKNSTVEPHASVMNTP